MKKNFVNKTDYGLVFTEYFFQCCLQKQFDDPHLIVDIAEYAPSASESMAHEIKNPKSGDHPIGVQRYNLSFLKNGEIKHVVVIAKSKISEQNYLQIITGAFETCGIKTRQPLISYLSQLEFENVNRKEIMIYEMQKDHAAFQQYLPSSYGTYLSEDGRVCVLILQYLKEEYLSLDLFNFEKWDQIAIDGFIDAISQLHAVWYGREKEVAKIPGFENVLDLNKMQQFMPYWLALLAAVEQAKPPFMQASDYDLHHELLIDLTTWRGQIDAMKKTLVHNDCVPKNVGINLTDGEKQIYVYDWELATVHLPQRDVVEFLSYVLPRDFSLELLTHYIERQRIKLAETTGENIHKQEWVLGFKYSIYDYLIQRIMPQIVFEKLEARNIEKVYANARRMMALLPE
ncbi:3-hydroxy-3-methylglutaryl coenzyme A reductase-like protein [Legionella lansingensis]|uniref:3-hydroxy-3-methylglutaryl coenzyme A reductase-like protein n=1 Tax=Legionella lansingensis TaxID=45067 RepID=A0A0W0V8P3_9GAMM|nr:phosphotransferase [Legionella lansingensis]KTD16009.1 3-hydroxy-3-methylglutaryl coenzyme A reductase-like protein [Legionella lansingensis]SNV56169.1 3-hydroxy-3-methylglutaryl coenzyme A reductase-like protein [Legionella lansingensis]